MLATGPRCAVYNALADNRLPDALEDYRRILAAGVNVVGSGAGVSAISVAGHPRRAHQADRNAAAREGNSSLFVNGIDPGFANDLLPLALAGTCQSIEQMRCMEIVDYATYDSATVMFDVMGFGKPIDEIPMLLQPGVLSMAWGSVVRQMAAGLGVSLDDVDETYVREPAPEDFDIAAGHIPKGSAAALRFEVIGHGRTATPSSSSNTSPGCARTCAPNGRSRPRKAVPTASRSTGEPSYAMDICLSSRKGDHNHAGLVATAMRVVNAIPAVVAAAPGIGTTLDLPLITGKGLYAG